MTHTLDQLLRFVEENDSGGSTAMRIGCGLCARRFD